MIQFLKQKTPTLLFIVLASVMVVLMSHDVGSRGGKDLAGEIIFNAGAPAVRAGASVTAFVGNLFSDYIDLRDVRRENRRLRGELLRTEGERDQYREAAAATERLQALLDLKRAMAGKGIAARIAGSGFASGADTLLLDRGSSSGIESGMPVIAVGGVVGRIVLAAPDVSKVQCLTDSASGVAVVLQQSGFQGILFGKGRGATEIQYLPAYAEVAPGDLVVTSGLDQIYPRGIPVGRIVGKPVGEGVARRFEVRPLVDFLRVSEVLVLPVEHGAGGQGPAEAASPASPASASGRSESGGSEQ
jgi:rod shape-determining protein MreC